jgi:hypothetical protein
VLESGAANTHCCHIAAEAEGRKGALNAGNAAGYTAVAGTGAVGNGARAGLVVGRVAVVVPAIGVIETSAEIVRGVERDPPVSKLGLAMTWPFLKALFKFG